MRCVRKQDSPVTFLINSHRMICNVLLPECWILYPISMLIHGAMILTLFASGLVNDWSAIKQVPKWPMDFGKSFTKFPARCLQWYSCLGNRFSHVLSTGKSSTALISPVMKADSGACYELSFITDTKQKCLKMEEQLNTLLIMARVGK